ncbi:MAG: hypothetical protein MJ078_03890 [Clostridia bacterium]|nr:hypothetical protein [Clostridia bacterium]
MVKSNSIITEGFFMVKLIVGVKGTGKTKTLIELVNKAVETSHGSVICIGQGTRLNYDIHHNARLVNTESFSVADAQALYGFAAGMTASNHDITDLFVDSALKICQNNIPAFATFVKEMDKLSDLAGYKVVMTVSAKPEDCYPLLKEYM